MNRSRASGALAGGAALLAIGGLDSQQAAAGARSDRSDGILRDLDAAADAWKIWVDPGNLPDGSLLYDHSLSGHSGHSGYSGYSGYSGQPRR